MLVFIFVFFVNISATQTSFEARSGHGRKRFTKLSFSVNVFSKETLLTLTLLMTVKSTGSGKVKADVNIIGNHHKHA